MRVAFLCNVGNRDLRVDGQAVPAEQMRSLGETIATRYEEYRGRLEAPLIEPGLKAALREGMPGDPAEVTAYLFVTDQDVTTNPLHRARDTVHMGRVLERLLKERFAHDRNGRVVEARALTIKGDPSSYDTMFQYYASQPSARALGELPDRVYVSPVGGVPAANFALLFRAIQRFGDRCVPIYLPEGRKVPLRLDLGTSVRHDTLREVARQALTGFEFGRAAALLTEVGAEDVLVGLAEHADHRLHFDFEGALRAIESRTVPPRLTAAGALLRDIADELSDLAEGKDQAALVRELFFNLRVAWWQGRYVDFLLRAFRLQEALLRMVVERDLQLPTDVEGGAEQRFIKAIEADAGLKAHFARKVDGRALDYQRGPNIPVLTHLLEYSAGQAGVPTADRHRAVLSLVRRMEGLSQLRNRSIGAHGFRGVSKVEIVAAYSAGDLLADIENGLQQAGLGLEADSLMRVRDFLLDQVGRGA